MTDDGWRMMMMMMMMTMMMMMAMILMIDDWWWLMMVMVMMITMMMTDGWWLMTDDWWRMMMMMMMMMIQFLHGHVNGQGLDTPPAGSMVDRRRPPRVPPGRRPNEAQWCCDGFEVPNKSNRFRIHSHFVWDFLWVASTYIPNLPDACWSLSFTIFAGCISQKWLADEMPWKLTLEPSPAAVCRS